jgi:glyoxylase-like metal-dependent hydrolase (beta-lactamase superfamily II)
MRRSRLIAAAGAVAVGAAMAVTGQSNAAAQQAGAAQQQDFSTVEIDPVKVTDNVYMLVGAGGNVTVQFGPEGVLVVDASFAPMAPKILAQIKKLSDKPIRYVVDTHVHGDHIGGNSVIAKAGRTRAGGNVVGDLGGAATSQAAIIAHENVLTRLSAPPPQGQEGVPFADWPTETFIGGKKEMLFNGEAVQILHQEAAHTDGDSLVMFRRNDVIATGDLFTTTMYPFIDDANGGTINGYINALNAILGLTVASNVNEGGTMVIPGHGRLSDEQDVIEYRDMATIVRDRIREYVKRGMTLEQVKARKPTLDWDRRYGDGFIKPEAFIEVIYKQMAAEKAAASPAPRGRSQQNQNTKTKGGGE